MIRVLTDLHHSVLYEALAILFVDRAILGPTELVVWRDGHYQTRTGPTTEEFGRTPMVVDYGDVGSADYVIATVAGTRPILRDVAERLGAVYIDHIGNAWDQPLSNRVLSSVANVPGLRYHPEFHRVPYTEPTGDRIGAFHASLPHMPECYRAFQEAGGILYGTPTNLVRPADVALTRAECLAIWHCKDADGYGFGVHEAFASGRAVIGHARHYDGKLAAPLFIRGETYLEPGDTGDLVAIGRQARAHFDSLVDFDAEADAVRDYLEGL